MSGGHYSLRQRHNDANLLKIVWKCPLTVSEPTLQALHTCMGSLGSDANAGVIIVLRRESSPMAQPAMKLLQRH